MEVRRDPRSFILFIILLLLINSPEPQGQPGVNLRSHYDDVLQREWDELDVLNRTRYGDLDPNKDQWLNISGLQEEDGFLWELLAPVQQRATEQTKGLLGVVLAEAFLDGSAGESEKLPVYQNISGYVQGEWARSPLGRVRHPVDLNASSAFDNAYPFAEYDRNLTGSGGTIRLHISELEGRVQTDENRTISEVTARVIIGDSDSIGGNWWEFVLNGVHFPRFGGIVLTTTSERFGGIFALPHLQLSQHLFSTSKELLNSTIHDTIERQANRVYPLWSPWSSALDGTSDVMTNTPHCEFVLYLQEHPVGLQSQVPNEAFDIDWLEHELRYPTGSSMPRRMPLSMSMVGFSPDCGFVIESKGPPDYTPREYAHLVGSKTEEFNDRAKHGIVAFAVTLLIQIIFLINQMKETATPSTRNRVSFYTIGMLAVGDGFVFLALIFMPLFIGTSQLALYATGFLALFSVVLQLRFLMDIWAVQVTEQMRQDREQASNSPPPATPAPEVASPSPETGGLPLPATARRPPTPIIIAPDQDDPDLDMNAPTATGAPTTTGTTNTNESTRAQLGKLYTWFIFLLLVVFFLTLQFTTTRFTVRAFYFNTLCFAYLSFWCPQIYRNIMRNCRKALRWDFVLGQSAVRLIPITYFYAVSDNVLFSRPDTTALLVLAGWVWLQILALASQELLGSRFFIREGWAPPAYDYHPILREDEEGATMPIGSSSTIEADDADASSPSTSKVGESKGGKGKKVFDCSICATDIEVPVIPSGGVSASTTTGSTEAGLGGMILQRRAYMVTPCRHIFHTPCLEGWMRYRLQCPNCREILPPL